MGNSVRVQMNGADAQALQVALALDHCAQEILNS